MSATVRARCDVCDARPWDYHCIVAGIETFYCWECAGEDEDPYIREGDEPSEKEERIDPQTGFVDGFYD